jgi:hypothetical protein
MTIMMLGGMIGPIAPEDALTADGVIRVEAVLLHRRDDHRPQCRSVGGRRSRYAGKEHARHDGDMCEPTADEADQRSGEGHDPFGDAAGVHQLARDDEERNGDEREGVDADEGPRDDSVDRKRVVDKKRDRRRDAAGKGDRHVDEQQDEERREENRQHARHTSCSGRETRYRSTRPAHIRKIRPIEIGMAM